MRLYLEKIQCKKNKTKAGEMAQVMLLLAKPSKHEALSSSPSTAKNK
jgi:hypothetical protein